LRISFSFLLLPSAFSRKKKKMSSSLSAPSFLKEGALVEAGPKSDVDADSNTDNNSKKEKVAKSPGTATGIKEVPYVFKHSNRARLLYWDRVFPGEQYREILKSLLLVKTHAEIIRGRTARRTTASFADTLPDGRRYRYAYSSKEEVADDWPPLLAKARDVVWEKYCEQIEAEGKPRPPPSMKPNYCLLNRYDDLPAAMPPHSDDEEDIVPGSVVFALSFGSDRTLVLSKKVRPLPRTPSPLDVVKELLVKGNSLYVMDGDAFQKELLHSVPKGRTTHCDQSGVRISLTFRTLIPRDQDNKNVPPPAKRQKFVA
jgi:alkylated DNA repair dioxygenase AlkB